MARTLHQAMAYLGLAENESERSQQSSRGLDPVYEETVFEADDTYEVFEGEEAYEQSRGQASRSSDRDVLLGLQGETRSYRVQQAPDSGGSYAESSEGSYRVSETAPLSADDFYAKEQHPAAASGHHTNSYTSDESDEELRRITTIHPRSYNDAKIIGESFRENIPVIMNVTDMGDTDAKRLVDFSAGLAFALHGSIERVTDKVFLLTPANLEVLGAEGAEMPVALDSDDSGLFNQG